MLIRGYIKEIYIRLPSLLNYFHRNCFFFDGFPNWYKTKIWTCSWLSLGTTNLEVINIFNMYNTAPNHSRECRYRSVKYLNCNPLLTWHYSSILFNSSSKTRALGLYLLGQSILSFYYIAFWCKINENKGNAIASLVRLVGGRGPVLVVFKDCLQQWRFQGSESRLVEDQGNN